MSKTQQQLTWDWLKAERRWQDTVRQWLRAEGASDLVIQERRLGRPEPAPMPARAARRARERARYRAIKRLTAARR